MHYAGTGVADALLLDQVLRETHRARCVGRVSVGADGSRILLRDGRTADHDDHVVADAGLLECVDVRLEHRHRRREESGEADDVGLVLLDRLDELLGSDVDAEVVDGEPGALEHDVDEVLADVVDVALDGAHDVGADLLRAGLGEERTEDVECALHRARRDEHLGNEEVAALEACADLLERRDERVVQHRLGLHVVLEAGVDEVLDLGSVADERVVEEALEDFVVGHAAPRA